MPGGWIAIFVLCLLLGAALYGAYQGWTAHSSRHSNAGMGLCVSGWWYRIRIAGRLWFDGACFLQQSTWLRRAHGGAAKGRWRLRRSPLIWTQLPAKGGADVENGLGRSGRRAGADRRQAHIRADRRFAQSFGGCDPPQQ